MGYADQCAASEQAGVNAKKVKDLERVNYFLTQALRVYADDSRWSRGRNELESLFLSIGNESDAKSFAKVALLEAERTFVNIGSFDRDGTDE